MYLLEWSAIRRRCVRRSRVSSDCRRGTDRCLCRAPGPSGGYVQAGHDLRPSTLGRTALRRGEVPPIEPPDMGGESNTLHAICSAFPLDTNNRLSTRTRGQDLEAGRELHGAAVAGQF